METEKKKITRSTILYGIFFAAALILLVLMLSGCTKQETAETDPYPDMPDTLRAMQGSWETIDTNTIHECGATIQGYTIRVRYRAQHDSPMLKHNASIDRIDENRNLMIINGGTSAWPYFFGPEDGQDHFELEFFSQEGWNRMHMKRSES